MVHQNESATPWVPRILGTSTYCPSQELITKYENCVPAYNPLSMPGGEAVCKKRPDQ